VGLALVLGIVPLGREVNPHGPAWWVPAGLVIGAVLMVFGLLLFVVPVRGAESRGSGREASISAGGVIRRRGDVRASGDVTAGSPPFWSDPAARGNLGPGDGRGAIDGSGYGYGGVGVPASPTGQPEPRIFLKQTPRELAAMFDGLTDLEGQRRIEPYLGKWMTVTGQLEELATSSSGSEWLLLTFSGWDDPVVMFFVSEWKDRLSVLTIGTPITVSGRVSKVGRKRVVLDPCELVPE